jgi:hypothetical protein
LPSQASPVRYTSFEHYLRELECRWGVNYRDPDLTNRAKLRGLLKEQAMANWRRLHPWASLRPFLDRFGPTQYIKFDDPRHLSLRARLRHNRSNLRTSLFKRKLCSDDRCRYCQNEIESLDHVVLSCPRLTSARSTLKQKLSGLNFILSTALILGAIPKSLESKKSRPKLLKLLSVTGEFLVSLDTHFPFSSD